MGCLFEGDIRKKVIRMRTVSEAQESKRIVITDVAALFRALIMSVRPS